jgi:hypothetical protein
MIMMKLTIKEIQSLVAAIVLVQSFVFLSVPAFSGSIDGCSDLPAGSKLVISSFGEIDKTVRGRKLRAILAAFEMRFERAGIILKEHVEVIYCDERSPKSVRYFDSQVVDVLNDEKVLLEVESQDIGEDISILFVSIPILKNISEQKNKIITKGFYQSIYEQSANDNGLLALFQSNAELRLVTAISLALYNEKKIESEEDLASRIGLINRSRALYCDAVGSAKESNPSVNYLGLDAADWAGLKEFAEYGAARMFDLSTQSDSRGSLAVVASERNSTFNKECFYGTN